MLIYGQLDRPLTEIFKDNNINELLEYANIYGVRFYENVNLNRYYVGKIINNKIVALGMFGISEWNGKKFWITALCSMNKGEGSLILQTIGEKIRILFGNVDVYIESKNDALKFYEKFGYIELESLSNGYTLITKKL